MFDVNLEVHLNYKTHYEQLKAYVLQVINEEDSSEEGKILCDYIMDEFNKDWNKFPQIIIKIFSANSCMFSKIIDQTSKS